MEGLRLNVELLLGSDAHFLQQALEVRAQLSRDRLEDHLGNDYLLRCSGLRLGGTLLSRLLVALYSVDGLGRCLLRFLFNQLLINLGLVRLLLLGALLLLGSLLLLGAFLLLLARGLLSLLLDWLDNLSLLLTRRSLCEHREDLILVASLLTLSTLEFLGQV